MLAFVSDIWFPASILILVLISQTVFEKEMMDGIVWYMPAAFVLDCYFKTLCSGISLFVDASTEAKPSLMLISDISRIRRLHASFK